MANPSPETALEPHIALIRLRAEAALLRRLNAGYGFADARLPAEIYLRDDAARERLSRDSLRPRASHQAQAEELEDAMVRAREALDGYRSPLTVLGDRFALDAAERALIAICLAYHLDPDVRDLCHALAWRRRSALHGDVCQELAPELATSSAMLRALHPGGALRRGRLIRVSADFGDSGQAGIDAELGLGREVLDWLLGEPRIADPLDTAVRLYPRALDFHVYIDEAIATQIERVVGHLSRARPGSAPERPAVVLIQGPLGSGKRAVAHRVAAALGAPLGEISLTAIISLCQRRGDPSLMNRALAALRMRGAVAYFPGIHALLKRADESPEDHSWLVVEPMSQYDGPAILATTERGMPSLPFARPFHLIRIPAATLEVRTRAWSTGLAALGDHLDRSDVAADTAARLAARYVIGPGTVGEVVADAHAFAQATGAPVQRAGIEEAVGRRLTLRLGSFGTVVTRRARLDDMVLPDDVKDTLLDMIAMVRERAQILERWGYGRHLGLNRGVSALFSGEPGTGKTMAASVISGALGLELIRIDLSAVTSKWVGETEKHLAKIFDEAQTANAMLLFDEADSLFGKRTELKSAQDRYANLEVNYVLQRMENFDGVSVLTTNAESAIDPAFLRRLNFRLRFPKPEFEERLELWRRLLPPDTNLGDDPDFDTLATRFEMTGGHIRNAIVRAAVVAAREGRAMQPDDLFIGAHHEYTEMGKVMPSLLQRPKR